MSNRFGTLTDLTVQGVPYRFHNLNALTLGDGRPVSALPFSLRVLLENLLHHEDGLTVTPDHIRALLNWNPTAEPDQEIAFRPGRVLLQDFTGVPAVVDLAAMREAMKRMGGDPARINPLQAVDLVIDHSIQVDEAGTPRALQLNTEIEYARNKERYVFLRWGQTAFANFRVVPPETGICHQVNLEYLATVALVDRKPADGGAPIVSPDTLVGTDSHTTMINGLGVLGWGVGGIEAEAAMLGQPISMLVPKVVGVRLHGQLPQGATATDLVLTVTQLLRRHGVVGKFVEFYGPGLNHLPLADRATLANMAPEYGATCGMFPIDAETINYLRLTGRPAEVVTLAEAYAKAAGLFRDDSTPDPVYSEYVDLDLSTVQPSLAGPKRPQDRVALSEVKNGFLKSIEPMRPAGSPAPATDRLDHGSVVIAAITSCTNTSNPSVMIAAGLLARKAVAKGLTPKPWVKASLAPGSKVVTEYLRDSGLLADLEALRFHVVGYGCTTCIGNSGPLAEAISKEIHERELVAAAVLSGNRNFEGRVNPDVRANYLASPPLVVAYALAGSVAIDLTTEPLGIGSDGQPVYLRDVWPTPVEVQETIHRSVRSDLFRTQYADVFRGDQRWRDLPVPQGDLYQWDETSTYVKHPPYFEGMTLEPPPVEDIRGARVLAVLGDSITTDHISPAGSIKPTSPAGRYLKARGVEVKDFNSYGARRGNHEVMVRGTFANIRLRNKMVSVEGGVTLHLPSGEEMAIYDAAERYASEGVPLVILAGKEYGSGSSRDWAAKGTRLLGIKAVLAESFERIHRSNLVGMGVLPLQFPNGVNVETLGLNGHEVFSIEGLAEGIATEFAGGREVRVQAVKPDGTTVSFTARVRIDTPQEVRYYRHGGIMPFVLRQLLATSNA